MDPHAESDGWRRKHVPINAVLNPHIKRPPADDPGRQEYDAALRAVLHIVMIFSGVVAVACLTLAGVAWYVSVIAQGIIPGAIQEVGDFKLHL